MKIHSLIFLAMATFGLAQGVTEQIAPDGQAPDGCQANFEGNFQITVDKLTFKANTARAVEVRFLHAVYYFQTRSIYRDGRLVSRLREPSSERWIAGAGIRRGGHAPMGPASRTFSALRVLSALPSSLKSLRSLDRWKWLTA